MTHSSLPENWQELIAGYALGDLSSEEAETLQRLLTENPELQDEVTQFQEVLALMPYALPDPEPPPRLRESILSQAVAETRPIGIFAETRSPAEPQIQRRRTRMPWTSLGGAIAAMVLLAIGIDNYRLRQAVQQNQITISQLQQNAQTNAALIAALRQPGAQIVALEGTDDKASGSLVYVPSQNQVTLVTDLPQLPTERIYRLWANPANATQPTYCGEFRAGAIVSWSSPEAVCGENTDRMLITSELAADPPVPKGDLVMKSRG
jgi:anti-sigma-K factor RskA